MNIDRLGFARVAASMAAAVTVLGVGSGSARLQKIAKPLIVPALAIALDPAHDRVLATGLAAATIGDVLLIDPDDDSALELGATAFGVMQGCYTFLLWRRGARPRLRDAVPRYAGWCAASMLLARRQPRVAPTLSAYGAVLAATSTLAAQPVTRGGDRRLVVGGTLFTVSDALIVHRRLFLTDERHRRVAEAVILSTYVAAQILLVAALTTTRSGYSPTSWRGSNNTRSRWAGSTRTAMTVPGSKRAESASGMS